MKKISIDEIEDYQYCPMLHYLKYDMGFSNFETINDFGSTNTTKVIMDDYRSAVLIDTMLFSLRELKKTGKVMKRQIEEQFGQEYYKNMDASDILGVSKNKYSGSEPYIVDFNILKRLINKFYAKDVIPIIADQELKTKINGVQVYGRVDAILQVKGEGQRPYIYKFFCPKIKHVTISKVMANYSPSLLFGSYILQKEYDMSVGYKAFYHMTRAEMQNRTAISEKDVVIFEAIASSVIEDIDKKISRPIPGIQKCYECNFLKVCNEYHK